jgi:hypothetical protein
MCLLSITLGKVLTFLQNNRSLLRWLYAIICDIILYFKNMNVYSESQYHHIVD